MFVMKIAVFTDTFIPNINGIVTSVLNSSKAMAAKGHKVFIFTVKPKNKMHEIRLLDNKIPVFYYPRLKIINYPDFQLAVPRIVDMIVKIKKIKPDIIHIHTPSFLGWSALMIAQIFKIPTIGTYHTFLPDFIEYIPLPRINKSKVMKRLTWSYTRRFYNKCSIVTTPSIAMKQELENHGIKRKVLFISNGVDTKRFHPIKTKKTGKTILHVGRIGYEKNIHVLLRAFSELLKKEKKARLVIAGKGPDLEKLKIFARQLRIERNVEFLGPVPYDKLPKLYSSADIFATASTIETEGLVILEAMACSLPIIGVNKLAVPYVVKHNENGFIAQPGNYKEIARYMDILLKDRRLREKFGKESLRFVKKFSLKDIINQLEDIYQRLKR